MAIDVREGGGQRGPGEDSPASGAGPTRAPRTRNASLDTLRVLAVLAVFFHHINAGRGVGDRGVDLFFVLSGYLIGGIVFAAYGQTGGINPFAFWRDRWLRTLPAYYAVLAVYAANEVFVQGSPAVFGPYAGFFQTYVYGTGGIPRFDQSWSLAVEEHFYLALPILLVVFARLDRRSWVIPAIISIGLTLLVARTLIVYAGLPLQPKLSHWRTDGLIVGLVLAKLDQLPDFRARLVRHRGALATTTVLALAFAGWVEVVHEGYFQTPVAIAFGMLVALAIAKVPALEVPGRTGVVRWLARISYSVYLVQPIVLEQVYRRHLQAEYGPLVGWSLHIALGLAATVAVSQLLYLLVERPGLALRDWLRTRSRAEPVHLGATLCGLARRGDSSDGHGVSPTLGGPARR